MSRELPIFPLPLVLFPGTTQPLHIFEPRYRRLVADALAGDERFGIAFQAAAAPAPITEVPPPPPAPGSVGCVAVIRSATPLPDGRSDIVTEGEQRFTVMQWLERPHPYRVALVEEFDDEPADDAEAGVLAAAVRRDFGRLSAALGILTDRDDPETDLSDDAERLSFQVSAALELEAEAKQALLAMHSTMDRLRRLAALLSPLSTDAEQRAVVRQRARGNGKGGPHSHIEPTA